MSILTRNDIALAIAAGEIGITPFDQECIGPNSYDVHLGDVLYRMGPRRQGGVNPGEDDGGLTGISLPFSGTGPGYPEGNAYWLLEPGYLFLGVTKERTFTPNHVPIMEGKSSMARLGISIHECAGFGDIGFDGHWTLEIKVTYRTILRPGMPIAQVFFNTVTSVPQEGYAGRYANTEALPVPYRRTK